VLLFEPTTKTLEPLHNEMLRYLNAMTVSREQRLSAVTAAIPGVLWYIVLIGGFLTIASRRVDAAHGGRDCGRRNHMVRIAKSHCRTPTAPTR
jgi:hypothetical protein